MKDIEKNTPNNSDKIKEELSPEEHFKQTVDKARPYIINLWAFRKKFIIFNTIILILTLAYLLILAKPYYDSSVTILPDYGGKEAGSTSSLGQLGGLAALAGGTSVIPAAPTEIYEDLIKSEAVLGPAIYSKYKTDKFRDSVNLIQYFKIKPDKNLPASLQERGMFIQVYKALTKGKQLITDIDRLSKILTVSVTMPEGQLSADVVNNIAESLDKYIRVERISYASKQRDYIEKRLMQVKDSLNKAEDDLMYFNEQNRLITQSPALIMEQGRLTRNLEIMNEVYLELSKQLELVKIDEVKDTPILNIKELAEDPIEKTGPKRSIYLIVIMFLSVLFSGLLFAFSNNIKKYISILGLDRLKIKGKKKI
jgi:uncharacterized protein involved in exopolysaccharide biosynthesis